MDKEMYELYKNFYKIKKMGYIPSISEYRHTAGRTFESLLGKESDELFLPDYNGIEIKTKKGYSKSKVVLFTANPDGKYVLSLQNLIEKYGKDKGTYKELSLFLNSKEKYIYNHHKFQVVVNRVDKEVVLNVYDIDGQFIENDTRWSFDLLKERLDYKLQKLALVKCCTKVVNGREHYWYYRLTFYKNLSFENFINAIEKGKIEIRFLVGVYRSGPKIGKMHNHGTAFAIEEKDLTSIYSTMI